MDLEIIVNGTLGQVAQALAQQRQRWEKDRAPAMLTGRLFGPADLNYLLKAIKDPDKRLPDETHYSNVEANESQAGRVLVVFKRGRFRDPDLFQRAVGEIVETLTGAGLEVELPEGYIPPIPIPQGNTWRWPSWEKLFDWYHRYGKPNGMTLAAFAAKIQRPDGTPTYRYIVNRHRDFPDPDKV